MIDSPSITQKVTMFATGISYDTVFSDSEQSIIKEEYKRLKDICYLDHTGCPLYTNSQIKANYDDLSTNVYSNPHSGSLTSKYCIDTVDQIRYKVLQHFNTNASEYSVIFTSGATASLKLVAESFTWTNHNRNKLQDEASKDGSYFLYMEDNHTSVLGMRNIVNNRGAKVKCVSHEDVIDILQNSSPPRCDSGNRNNSLFAYSAQCNFSGVKYPLSWVNKVQSGILNRFTEEESNWYCLLDAATFVSTNKLDLSSIKPDFVTISFYKIFGFPTGLGALLVRNSSSYLMEKYYYGGGTVLVALSEENTFVPRPVLHERFEDGTINFLSIISVGHGFKNYQKVADIDTISKHCFELAKYTFQYLLKLHHANGQPVTVMYADTCYNDIKTQGNIVNFNILRSNGEYAGFSEVMNLANLHGIQLRTGCFCNPGACRRHLKLTTNDVLKHFESGHVCGDDNDLIDGQPTGSIRVSFGPHNTIKDAINLLKMIESCFVLLPAMNKLPEHWHHTSNLLKEKFALKPIKPVIRTDKRLEAINYIYFWLENVYDVMGNCGDIHSEEIKCTEEIPTALAVKKNARSHLSHIFLYPIKSCGRMTVNQWELSSTGLRYDREWMITNQAGVVITQKTVPHMCMIRPIIDLEGKKIILSFKGYPSFSLDLETGTQESRQAWLCSSKVCGDAVRGFDCGDSVSLWLSHVMRREGLRLVRQQSRDSKIGGNLSLSNQAQYLLMNKQSINWLSEKLEENSECKLGSMLHRFRSNFVFDGPFTPFQEQTWSEVKIGSQHFKVDAPCTRCQMICIDQDNGEKTKEPLTTLAASTKGKLKFGIYLSKNDETNTILSIGDPILFTTKSESA